MDTHPKVISPEKLKRAREWAAANPPKGPAITFIDTAKQAEPAPSGGSHSDRRPESSTNGAGPDQANRPPENPGVGGPGAGQSDQGSGREKEEPRHTLNSILKDLTNAGGVTAPLLLQDIGKRFTEARKLNKPEAWRQLQADLMHNSYILCPAILGYKDLITTVREIEDFMKGSVGQVGRSNEEVLAEFLSGEGPIATKVLEASADEAPIQITESAPTIPPEIPLP